MKIWGLAAAGTVSRTFLSRLPILSRNLGPVVSTSFRVATRISNALRAGTAIRDFAGLQNTREILICLAGPRAPDLLQPAFLEAIDWKGKVALFCDCDATGPLRERLRRNGAYTGSLTTLPQLPGCMLLEGDREAVRTGRVIAKALKAREFCVPQDRLLLFQAAVTASGSLFLPLIETVVECLRQSGLGEPFVANISEALFHNSLRVYRRSGRKCWGGTWAQTERDSVEAQIQALQSIRPHLGEFFRDSAEHSSQLCGLRAPPGAERRSPAAAGTLLK